MFFKKFFAKLKNKQEYQHLKDESKIKLSAEIFKTNFKSQITDINTKIQKAGAADSYRTSCLSL